MPSTILTSREFHQDTRRAKKAARRGPVFITDRGRFTHVLLSIGEYQRLVGQDAGIADMLSMPNAAGTNFEPAHVAVHFRPAKI